MDPVKTFNALIGPIRRRVRLMISRALLSAVNDIGGLQVVQVKLLADEVRDSVERFQNYGFTSHPKPGAEGIVACVSGNRDHGVVIVMDDRRFRLHLEEGEAAIYDDLGHKVHLTRNGIVVDGAGHQILFTNAPNARFEMNIEATGEIKDLCDTAGITMSDMRSIYNGHTHNDPQGGAVAAPNQGM
jgi:phage baseplate assembly protein V